jgi:hypothetical protein
MDDTQNYYITPPTIFLPEEGLRITVIGTDEDWTEQLSDDLEDTFPTVPMTFYHLDERTNDQWQWLYHMVDSSDLIMVNVGRCTALELNLAFLTANGNKVWFFVDKEVVDKEVRILLNSINANVFNNREQLHLMLRNFVGE